MIIRRMKSSSVASIHGPANTITANIETSLGMNERVISLICVAAWKIPTTRPAASAANSRGAEIRSVT